MATEMTTMSVAERLAELQADLANAKAVEEYKEKLSKEAEARELERRIEMRNAEVKAAFDREQAELDELQKHKLAILDADAKAEYERKAKITATAHKMEQDLADQIAKAKAQGDQKLAKKLQDYKNKLEEKGYGVLAEKKVKAEEKAKKKADRKQATKEATDTAKKMFAKGTDPAERFNALKATFTDSNGQLDMKKGLVAMTNVVGDFAKELNGSIESIAKQKGAIDTRLQGSKHATGGMFGIGGSYWDNIQRNITGAAGVSPLIKQEDVVTKLNTMVSKGIASNIEQRAFLDVLKDKIATTFEATNSTLVRLVRIQQADTTAARLGMESALTAFLNNMYETTEYMSDVMNSVKSSLEEAESLMGAKSAAAFEYQVQKWMGSMYSVGMSQNGVQSIANALGQIAAGDISGLTGSGTGNLVVMAANNAGLSIADMLADGLDDSNTNKLMAAMVDYLGQIYEETKDSKVIGQQYASVFGLKASDLKAISNLSSSDRKNIASNGLNYEGMIKQLNNMANSMYSRMSMGEILSNSLGNLKYTMASGIASNPALYATYQLASMLDSTTGGIAIPAFSVMGNMVDLETTVANLMRVGALGGSLLSGIGTMIAAGGNGGLTGGGILRAIGVSNSPNVVSRGSGGGLLSTGGATVSESGGMIGNSSSSDVQDKVLGDAQGDADKQLIEKQDENNEVQLKDVNEQVIAIYTLLNDVVTGSQSFNVTFGDNLPWPDPNKY